MKENLISYSIKKDKEMEIKLPDHFYQFVSERIAQAKCPAHDLAHCKRVANLAVWIAEKETGVNIIVTYIAGLMHDMLDSKLYSSDSITTAETEVRKVLENESSLNDSEVNHIISIVKSVGYKNMIRSDWDPYSLSVEYRCVQDADLLDAIGAIGVARCYAYGGRKNRNLFGVSKNLEESVSQASYLKSQVSEESNVDHFFDKLLRIPSLIITSRGKEAADKRYTTMKLFLEQVDAELEDAKDSDAGTISTSINELENILRNSQRKDRDFSSISKKSQRCVNPLTCFNLVLYTYDRLLIPFSMYRSKL